MPHIIKLGIPCHFRPSNANVSACGVGFPEHAAYDGRDVDCLRCRKTKKWKVYMGHIEQNEIDHRRHCDNLEKDRRGRRDSLNRAELPGFYTDL